MNQNTDPWTENELDNDTELTWSSFVNSSLQLSDKFHYNIC